MTTLERQAKVVCPSAADSWGQGIRERSDAMLQFGEVTPQPTDNWATSRSRLS